MDSIKLTSSVSEPELDMNRRRMQVVAAGRMRRLISTILGYQGGVYSMGTPRRSIDRELQQYSPSYE
jgi:hypothetical protein